jgi:hypothetical protein
MSTYEDRLTTLEKTIALLQKRSGMDIQEVNRNSTMLLGIVSSQQMDIKEIKVSLLNLEERLDGVDRRIEGGFDTLDRRLGVLEGKFDQVLAMLSKLTGEPG